MTVLTAVAGGGDWNTAATWSPAQVPTAADDCVLGLTSGNVTVSTAASARSLDCLGYTGTLSINSGVFVTLGDATAGAGNRALRLATGMTHSTGGDRGFTLASSSATVQTVTSAGKQVGVINFGTGAVSPSYQLTDALSSVGNVNLARGTFDTNSQAVTCAGFGSSNGNVRTLTLGSSTVTLTGSSATTVWDVATSSNMTITANTASIVVNNGGGANFGALNMNGASLTYTATTACTVNSPGTWANVIYTNTAVKTASIQSNANLAVTGTFTVTANSATNRVLVYSSVLGTARSITAAAVSLTNVDFMDITGAGAASWTGTSLGDCGGNTGITFSPATTRYAVAAGNWSSTAVWSATSGGSAGASVPLPQDNAVLNASSGVGTITIDMPRACKDLTCTGYTGTLQRTLEAWIFGSAALGAGMTLVGTAYTFRFRGRGSHVVTSAGKTWNAFPYFDGPGGTYTLTDAFASTQTLYHASTATLATAGFTVTTPCYSGPASSVVLNSASTWFITANDTISTQQSWLMGGTVIGAPNVVFTDTSASTKTFAGGGKVYNNLVIQGGALNSVAITGSNTFANVNVPAGTVFTPASLSTQTITGNLTITGAKYNGLVLPGVAGNYASTPDAAPLRITGDIEIVCRFGLSVTASQPGIIGKHVAYRINLDSSGTKLEFSFWNGSGWRTIQSAACVSAGVDRWYRVRRVASSGLVTIEYAADAPTEPASWTSASSGTLDAGVSIASSSSALEVGSRDVGLGAMAGTFYRAIVRSGIGGTTVFDADFTAKPWGADSFTEAQGATVTINGDLAKAGDGRVLLNSSTPGTKATISAASGTINGDYLVVVDSTATGGAVFNAGVRSFVTSSTGWNATGTLTRTACALHSLTGRSAATKAMTMSALAVTPATGRAAATKACNIAAKAAAAHLGSATTAKAATLGAKGPHAIAGGVGKRYAWWKVIEGGS